MIQVHVGLCCDLFDLWPGMSPKWHQAISVSLWQISDDGKKRSLNVGGLRSKGMFLHDREIAETGRRAGQALKEWEATKWMICIHGGQNPPNYNPGPNETFPVPTAHQLEVFQESLNKEFKG